MTRRLSLLVALFVVAAGVVAHAPHNAAAATTLGNQTMTGHVILS